MYLLFHFITLFRMNDFRFAEISLHKLNRTFINDFINPNLIGVRCCNQIA